MSPAHVTDILRGARERVARGWTRHYFAHDDAGLPCPCYGSRPVRWSLAGGAMAAELDLRDRGVPGSLTAWDAALRALSLAVGGNAEVWQDEPGRTQAEVLALLDRVIASEEQGPTPARAKAGPLSLWGGRS